MGPHWKYDFQTLKWSKSVIFRNWVRGLRAGPDWIFLIGKCLVVVVLMFGSGWIVLLVILRHLPPSSWAYPCFAWRFWDVWLKQLGQRLLEGHLVIFVDWELVWNASIWCLEVSWLGFCSFEKPFLWTSFIVYVYAWRFWDLGAATLSWKLFGVWIRSGVAWIFRLGSFLLKCSLSMPHHSPFEFGPSINF